MHDRATILIVDDEVSNIEIMNAVLEDYYQVSFATSGEQALEVARSVLPDLVLLDVMMPGVDGYEVCSRLKNDGLLADVPVIFTTALDDQYAEVRGLSLGAIDYVTKPINPVILKARVSNHIGLKRLRDHLSEMAITDALTGLNNRRQLEIILTAEISRLSPAAAWLSVIMVDIDFFKLFNDTYGHPEGDRCITMVAAVLARTVNKVSGMTARYGGEEFACVLPGSDPNSALATAKEIQLQIQSLNIPHPGSPVGPTVTVSIGIASDRTHPEVGSFLWLQNADQQLYISKRTGRNKIEINKFKLSK
ncbi:diguanylate cyclase [Brucella thiophenivorans]|uniref:diguanylate cyclase n=1 Tax=Brucella thiophenivorans TaxID=571255 RepID=A0A256G7A3_9HYPH|nr:diguanylate cyclase [Brucella thiophenivorans]OYR22982.1 diguanylate cyclase domain protein [Brucella thiophenivorans]